MMRLAVKLSDTVYEYYKARSVATGTPMSSLMQIALTEYMEQKLGIEAISGLYAEAVKQKETKNNDNS